MAKKKSTKKANVSQEKVSACVICDAKVCRFCASLAVIAGVLFLLQDLGVWNFWNISWYTVGFILAGLAFLKHK
ncbi:hypothetical protein GF336_06285 [Candidatus Woesearchaeota archaeon]|nr:hypothetical protein [Candidatus Woesearchaeota archaeon]